VPQPIPIPIQSQLQPRAEPEARSVASSDPRRRSFGLVWFGCTRAALKNPEPCWRWEPPSPPLLGQTGTARPPLRAGAAAAAASRFGIGTRGGERRVVGRRPRQPPSLSSPPRPPRTLGRPARAPYRRTMSSSTPAAAASPPPAAAADEGARAAEAVPVDERVASHVDPFLVEALDNPRHRLMGTCRPPPHVSARRLARDFGVVGSRVRGCDCRGGSAWAGCWISARIRASCP